MKDVRTRFAAGSLVERSEKRLAPCPPHVKKNWHLGLARLQRQEERKHSMSKVASSVANVRFIFTEDIVWQNKLYRDMDTEEQQLAGTTWMEAEEPGSASSDATNHTSEEHEIRTHMADFMKNTLKWTQRELHDSLVNAGMSIPATPSLVNYFAALHLQFGDKQNGFLPQNWQSHTKARITEILPCLSRTGLKMGGRLSDPKKVLAERLSHWLNKVCEAGRTPAHGGADGDSTDSAEGVGDDKLKDEKNVLNDTF